MQRRCFRVLRDAWSAETPRLWGGCSGEEATAPLPVQPAAVAVLRALDGQKELSAVAAALEAPPEAVEAVAAELCRVGAAGPV